MEMKLHGLDLFSGIGGLSVALEPYVRTVAYCEADRHAQAVLISRMAEGAIDNAPICTDVRELAKDSVDIPIDIIFGGFPCQDISVAGKGVGLAGERSGLFYEVVRLAKEVQPTFLFLENVPAIRTRGLDRVIEELTEAGYDCRWTMLSASEVGAPHKRERWFCLAAHSQSTGCQRSGPVELKTQRARTEHASSLRTLADSYRQGLEVGMCQPGDNGAKQSATVGEGWWQSEPNVGRVVNGVPQRVDRIKRLGNAVVPAQAREAFEILMFGKGLTSGT